MRKKLKTFIILFFAVFTYSCNSAQVLTINDNVIQLFNECTFDVQFDLINAYGTKTSESIDKLDQALYKIGIEGELIIIRSNENDPSHNDRYKVVEKRRYAFQYIEETDEIILIELTL